MTAKNLPKAIPPSPARYWLRTLRPRIEHFFRRFRSSSNIGSLRRITPVSTNWGGDRGQIIDRYYIEKFLAEHAEDVRGHVLEFGDNFYARKFGGTKATKVDVLHLVEGNPRATIVADLARGERIPSDTFDCILCTQVLQYIYDVRAAIQTLYRILRPGGVLLVTAPGIQKIDRGGKEDWGEFWRFTTLSLHRLFEEVFPKESVQVRAYGNVLAAAAFLYGYAVEDLRQKDLDYHDPDYEGPIVVRAVKPSGASPFERPSQNKQTQQSG